MDSVTCAAIAFAILAFALVSGRLQKGVITSAMVFVTLGLIIGPYGLDMVRIHIDTPALGILAELTLVLVLFTDAARIDLRILWGERGLPMRLLGLGFPLTFALGTVAALLLFRDIGLGAAALIGAILAPTDAALGLAVVTNAAVPIRIRQALNVESGLNDGLALPVVLTLAEFVGAHYAGATGIEWVGEALGRVIVGVGAGLAIGYLGGKAMELASRTAWMSPPFQRIGTIALALLAFALTSQMGGNGFIAAFAAGLMVGHISAPVRTVVLDFAETEGHLMALLTFLAFGITMVPSAFAAMDGTILVYALLSLTVIRMVPVFLCLVESRLRTVSKVFIAWFGPRGLASVLFSILMLEHVPAAIGSTVMSVVTITVLMSVFAHGITAGPAAAKYARACECMKKQKNTAEFVPVAHQVIRGNKGVSKDRQETEANKNGPETNRE